MTTNPSPVPPEPNSPDVPPEPVPTAVRDTLTGLGYAAAGANVVMQLSRLPVGHGVARSTVDSGRADKHPIKRLRTTSAFLVIALLGTDEERLAIRAEIAGAHKHVRSQPADPVPYNAFDPELQLWVAACLYKGTEDVYRLYHPDPDPGRLEQLYWYSRWLGTTLQVTEEMWPPTRAAFEQYWRAGLSQIEMDDLTRRYLQGIAELSFLVAPLGRAGRPLEPVLRPIGRYMTLGFLPPEFRELLGLPWTPRQQARFDRWIRRAVAVSSRSPRLLREFPFNVYLWDTRRRIRKGIPVV